MSEGHGRTRGVGVTPAVIGTRPTRADKDVNKRSVRNAQVGQRVMRDSDRDGCGPNDSF